MFDKDRSYNCLYLHRRFSLRKSRFMLPLPPVLVAHAIRFKALPFRPFAYSVPRQMDSHVASVLANGI